MVNDDSVIFTHSNGKRERRYRSHCSACSYDKGYVRKSRLNKICHLCNSLKAKESGKNWAGKSKEVLKKIKKVRSKQVISHSLETKKKIALSNEKTKSHIRTKNGLFKNTYSKKKIREKVGKLIRTRIKRKDIYYDSDEKIGYLEFTFKEFVDVFEEKFQPNMTWDNYGEWHIDHIKPISSFNYISVECNEYKDCWSLDNLQPLWAIDNLKKSNK